MFALSVSLRHSARPTRPPRQSLPLRAQVEGIEPWQESRLHQAAKAGRRAVKVSKLCQELHLPRATVLQWLKEEAPEPDRLEVSLSEARVAAEEAARQRQAVLQEHARQQSRLPATPTSASAGGIGSWYGSASGGTREVGRPRAGGAQPARQGGQPSWRQRGGGKALGRQAEATLEMVFSRTPWPSDEVVENMWALHRISRERVIEWFSARRRRASTAGKARRARGNSSDEGGWGEDERSSSGRRAPRAPRSPRQDGGGKTNWDAEWMEGIE